MRTSPEYRLKAGGLGGPVAELAASRDDAEIRLMRKLDEFSLAQ